VSHLCDTAVLCGGHARFSETGDLVEGAMEVLCWADDDRTAPRRTRRALPTRNPSGVQ
jgi:hypothetical protein